jgi:hypothetical protein
MTSITHGNGLKIAILRRAIGVFLLGGIVLGILLSRFLHPSEEDKFLSAAIQEEKDALTLRQYELERKKIEKSIQNIPRNDTIKVSVFLFACIALIASGMVVALGYSRKLSTRILKIGEFSEIPVRYSDLPKYSEIAMSLATAEQLRAQFPEQAMELQIKSFDAMLRSLVHFSHRLPQTPLSLQSDAGYHLALSHHIPSFRELLENETIGNGKPIVFGYSESGCLRQGTWVDLFSSAIGGVSGTGKTATLRSLIAQSLLSGEIETIWIIDPHYPHPKSLLSSLGTLRDHPSVRYVENDFDIPELLTDVKTTIERRLHGQEDDSSIKVLCIDEVLSLCKKMARAVETILKIGSEGRKAKVYGLFSSQIWKADCVGGSEVRDCLTSRFCHKMPPNQANVLLQDKMQSRQVKDLPPGKALFSPVNGIPEVLSIPFCSPGDMPLVAEIMNIHKKETARNACHAVQPETYHPMNALQGNKETDRAREETPEERQETKETAFLYETQQLRELVERWIETEQETLSGLAKKISMNKGQLYRFWRKGETPSDSLRLALSQYAGKPETPETPEETTRNGRFIQ